MSEELRKHPRIDSLNLSYLCIDDAGTIIEQNMGRTLNVSATGICLETHFEIKPNYNLVLTIAFEEDLIEVKGKIAYCRPGVADMYETGVEFTDMDDNAKEIYQKYVQLFDKQKAKA